MTRLLATRGLPGSGKSTAARQLQAAAPPGTVAILSRDGWRETVLGLDLATHPVLDRVGEDAITAALTAAARAMLAHGVDVIADAMHLTSAHVQPWADLAVQVGADLDVTTLDLRGVPLADCLRQDAARGARGGRRVGDDVICRRAVEAGLATEEEVTRVLDHLAMVADMDLRERYGP